MKTKDRATRHFRRARWALLLPLLVSALAGQTKDTPVNPDERIARWQGMRFGMFIHWGPVSQKGTEIGWSRGAEIREGEYDSLYRTFNPVKFDADEWVSVAKNAGMRYIVLVSKHHDGFCEWDTRYTPYNIMKTPFARDVIGELSTACRRQGLAFGLYYSILDWHHPDYPLGSPGGKSKKPSPDMDRYNRYLKDQLRELVTRYGPFFTFWFDGQWEDPWTYERGADLYRYVRDLQPGILASNRVGRPRKGPEGTVSEAERNPGDYDTPEQEIGRFNRARPWESCITICEQWAWKPNDTLKSLERCIRTLIECAGGDGNLLLNVGPMPTGEIESRQVARLKEMGAWLAEFGTTIYGTRGGPYKPGAWGASTLKGDKVYLHIFSMPPGGLELPKITRKILGAKLLTGGTVQLSEGERTFVRVAGKDLKRISTIVELTLDGPAGDINPLDLPSKK